jgi:hypothetical protein
MNFSGLQSLFVVSYDHSTVGHLDLFEYQSIPYRGWVMLDGSGCGI